MSSEYGHTEFFRLGGLSLDSSYPEVDANLAKVSKNMRRTHSGATVSREGSQVVSDTNTGTAFGTFVYKKTNSTTFIETYEELVACSSLYKITDYTLAITYSGSGNAVYQMLLDEDSGHWKFTIFVDGVENYSMDLGVGYDETSPVTIGDLVADLDAEANYTATISSAASSYSAAYIPMTPPTSFVGGSPQTADIVYKVKTQVNQPTGSANPFAQTAANSDASNFENVSAVESDGNIYFFTKYDEQKKYDGNDVYRSGAPVLSMSSVGAAGSGTLAAGTYRYIITSVQIDQNNLEVESDESAFKSITNGGATNNNITIQNILAASGYNTDCAVVNGAGQVNVRTITVDNGSGGTHTMKVGQRAYFYDAISAGYVTRTLTAVTSTTIAFSVSEAAVTVADNAVISNNLRIRIYRTENAGTIYRRVVDIPNNSFSSTQVYNDGLADASLGTDYTSPAELGINHGLPPKAAYGAKFNGRPVACGLSGDPSAFAWASALGPEYYPDNYSDTISGESNSAITGARASDKFLYIHQAKETFVITGDLFSGQYSIDKRGDAVGCISNSSIVNTDAGFFWVASDGVYFSSEGSIPTNVSRSIQPIFNLKPLTSERRLRLERSVAVWDSKNKLYICFIPAESEEGGEFYANQYSRIFVYDAKTEEWFEWDAWNMAGGAAYNEAYEELWWTERQYSAFDADFQFKTWNRIFTRTLYDGADHAAPIPWRHDAHEYHAGQPSVGKKYLTITISSDDPDMSARGDVVVRAYLNKKETPQTVITQSYGSGSATGWGFGAWGFFPWGQSRSQPMKKRSLKKPARGECIQITFSGGTKIYTKALISSYSLELTSPYKVKMKDVNSSSG